MAPNDDVLESFIELTQEHWSDIQTNRGFWEPRRGWWAARAEQAKENESPRDFVRRRARACLNFCV